MSGKRYTDEFKIEAVKQVTDRGYAVADVAKRLGITTKSLTISLLNELSIPVANWTVGNAWPVKWSVGGFDAMKNALMDVVGSHFRPEFVNRIDDVVVFHPLGREHIRKIVDIQLGYLHDRLAEREISIDLSDEARDKLADAGFDPVYGARPLKRAIQHQVENPLAQEILRGRFKPGDVIKVGVDEDRLDFRSAA